MTPLPLPEAKTTDAEAIASLAEASTSVVEGSATRLPDTPAAAGTAWKLQTAMTAAGVQFQDQRVTTRQAGDYSSEQLSPSPPPTRSQYGAQSSQYLEIKGIRV